MSIFMSDDSLPLENAHEHKNVFPFAMAEIASRMAVAGLARRRASAAWLTGHGRVQSVKVILNDLIKGSAMSVTPSVRPSFHNQIR